MTGAVKTARRRHRLRRAAALIASLAALAVIAAVLDGWKAFGRGATGRWRARMERSPQWTNGHFDNPQPLRNDFWGALTGLFGASPRARPALALPTVAVEPERFRTPPASGLRVTWLGHSTVLVEIDGHRVLTDPVWGERPSPSHWIGPRRWYPPLIALDDLPDLDAVVISHEHYDHLDYPTIAALKKRNVPFIVPLGVGANLRYWGVPETRIIELDWWERARVRGLEIVSTPARHASGRTLFDNNGTLWTGYALLGPAHRAYYSGDTGLFPALAEIGRRLGPFDVTMIEIGAYDRAWPDWHIGPEQAVRAHGMVRGRVMLPVHWGLFNLAFHGWTEPIERALAAGQRAGATIVVPRPGQSFEPEAPPALERWWPNEPWLTAEQNPIVSTQTD